ncbi:Multicopper oxidase [Ceratobasidium sp. AG-Ba]|nr:Multicopper oxidase [Ceratobasidium sp. AG-Ba]
MLFPRPTAVAVFTLFIGLGLAQSDTTTSTTTSATSTSTATALTVTATPVPSQLILSSDFVITDVPATRTYNWVVATATGSPDGYYRPMLVVNGQYPGPMIEANEGDTVIVNVQNDMSVGTTIHWHGIGQYGTYWWHAHASTQLADGIHGPLIVHSPNDPLKRGIDFDEEQVIMVLTGTMTRPQSSLKRYFLLAATRGVSPHHPPTLPSNGRGTWDCATYGNSSTCFTQTPTEIQVLPNKKYRFRLINSAAHAMFWYSIDSHTLNVTEADDTPVYSEANSALHRLKFHDGQRYSVIVDTSVGSVGDAYWMRAQMNTACLTALPKDFANTTYAVVRYVEEIGSSTATTGEPTTSDWTDVLGTECKDLDTASLVPIVAQDAPTTVVQRGIFDTGFTISTDSNGNLDAGFAVNGTSFVDLVYQPALHKVNQGLAIDSSNLMSVTYNTTGAVDLIINNLDSAIDHPYHLHGMSFWIVGEGSGLLTLANAETMTYNTTNPIRRDTHIIPANSWAVLRFEATNPGVWFMHCHIDWHLAEGFALLSLSSQTRLPKCLFHPLPAPQIPAGLNENSTSLGRRSLPGGDKTPALAGPAFRKMRKARGHFKSQPMVKAKRGSL